MSPSYWAKQGVVIICPFFLFCFSPPHSVVPPSLAFSYFFSLLSFHFPCVNVCLSLSSCLSCLSLPGLSSPAGQSLLLLLSHLHHPPSLIPPTAPLCQPCCPGAVLSLSPHPFSPSSSFDHPPFLHNCMCYCLGLIDSPITNPLPKTHVSLLPFNPSTLLLCLSSSRLISSLFLSQWGSQPGVT